MSLAREATINLGAVPGGDALRSVWSSLSDILVSWRLKPFNNSSAWKVTRRERGT